MDHLKELLDREAARINRPEFVEADPVQFPRQFDDQKDIEIASLLAAQLAWGRREMIVRDCQRLFALMDWQPHRYVMEQGYEELEAAQNIHRTLFARDLQHYLRGLRRIYGQFGTLEEFACSRGVEKEECAPWKLAEAINFELAQANGGKEDSLCLPLNLKTTALKRLNMALRWLVRDDGIVDLGIWRGLWKPSQLFIPLDVHVGNTSRELGLLTRRSNDRMAVEELTATLRQLRPEDPAYYDFALFGIGIEKEKREERGEKREAVRVRTEKKRLESND